MEQLASNVNANFVRKEELSAELETCKQTESEPQYSINKTIDQRIGDIAIMLETTNTSMTIVAHYGGG